jgi:hypothetical protein
MLVLFRMSLFLRVASGISEVAGAVNDALHTNCFVYDPKQDEIVAVHRHPKPAARSSRVGKAAGRRAILPNCSRISRTNETAREGLSRAM